MPYSLLSRSVERDVLPMARAHDLAILPWGTLRGGKLTVIPILGCRSERQLEDNLGCLDFRLSDAQLEALDSVSGFNQDFPNAFLHSQNVRNLVFGDTFALLDDHRNR